MKKFAFVAAIVFWIWCAVPAWANGGNITIKNLSSRNAAVVVEVTTEFAGKPGHFVKSWTFCLRPGQVTGPHYTHMDFFRVRAELRKVGDCRTPNVQATLQTNTYRSAIPYGGGILSFPGQKSGWLQNHDVIIEGKYSWTIRVVNNK